MFGCSMGSGQTCVYHFFSLTIQTQRKRETISRGHDATHKSRAHYNPVTRTLSVKQIIQKLIKIIFLWCISKSIGFFFSLSSQSIAITSVLNRLIEMKKETKKKSMKCKHGAEKSTINTSNKCQQFFRFCNSPSHIYIFLHIVAFAQQPRDIVTLPDLSHSNRFSSVEKVIYTMVTLHFFQQLEYQIKIIKGILQCVSEKS